MHRFKADEAYQLDKTKGPVGAYLDIDGILGIAVAQGVDAIHPGYGFLSENPELARACAKHGIAFVGPRAELLGMMGDKTAARDLARKAGVPTLPGTEEPVEDREAALALAPQIGFPLIIKAAHGGGGRGMRVVREAADLGKLLDEASTEARNAFGNGAVFLERFIEHAKHIEVQIIGDHHGNVVHLHERDCSVQRRHQKVIEVAPSMDLSEATRTALCEAAVRLGAEIGYDNAGTVEFLVDADSGDWFFIEMNPRIQVEHTVTEEITNIDLVRSQILVAAGKELHGPEIRIPPQAEIPRIGYAVQCRITTEDPENAFAPDIGRILSYRSPAGCGVRLDAATATTGAVVSPYYDSMLVKLTVRSLDWENALERMERALREFRIRGVKTNIPFLENVIKDPTFRSGKATTRLIDTTPSLFELKARRDRATKLLNYLGETTVNGNPHVKGYRPPAPLPEVLPPHYDRTVPPRPGTRQILLGLGPKGLADWTLAQERALVTDTTLRDAHQSLLATRMRTADMLRVAGAYAHLAPGLFSLEMWGGATFDTSMRFLNEDPWARLRQLRERIPNICLQMLLRGANAVGYSNYPDNVVKRFVGHSVEAGMDIFRIFDSLNYVPNLIPAMEAVLEDGRAVCEAAICYTGNILDPKRHKYDLAYYLEMAKELERAGAHFLAIKDMAGLLRPYAADVLFRALKAEIGIPIHFHTHDTSGLNAASVLRAVDAGVDVVDGAISGMSGSTSQPNLNSMIAALEFTARDTGLGTRGWTEPHWTPCPTIGSGCGPTTSPSTPAPPTGLRRSTCMSYPEASSPTSRSRPVPWGSASAGPRSPRPMPTSTSSSRWSATWPSSWSPAGSGPRMSSTSPPGPSPSPSRSSTCSPGAWGSPRGAGRWSSSASSSTAAQPSPTAPGCTPSPWTSRPCAPSSPRRSGAPPATTTCSPTSCIPRSSSISRRPVRPTRTSRSCPPRPSSTGSRWTRRSPPRSSRARPCSSSWCTSPSPTAGASGR